jgi:hypothetical protein
VKNFWSAEDIENLAAQGKTEVVIGEDTVLTDLARHTAQQLGIKILYQSRPASVVTTTPPLAPSLGIPGGRAGPVAGFARPASGAGKPKGCQHGPLTGNPPEPASASSSNTLVEQLVGLVKRLGSRESGT